MGGFYFPATHPVTKMLSYNSSYIIEKTYAVFIFTLLVSAFVVRCIPTVNFLNIRTPQKFVLITLKFELCGSTIE